MATPVKNLIDATGLTFMAPKTISIVSTHAITNQNTKNQAFAVQIQETRFTVIRSYIGKQIPSLTEAENSFDLKNSSLSMFKTFPSGYHESSKRRPTEGVIFPRKRIKNY
ncbi:MAG: hypothetical protein JHC33_00610 [Ignisphaera sp.]|nr:hypothetical protein [Ignisphaera sp.]